MSEEAAGLVFGAWGLLAVAAVCWWVRHAHRAGDLPPNGIIGIRTRATRQSHEAWDAGHEAASPWLLTTAVVGLVCGVLVLVLAIWGNDTAVVASTVLMFAGFAAVIVLAVLAGRVADRSARALAGLTDDS